jgi:hypothetical protein
VTFLDDIRSGASRGDDEQPAEAGAGP